MKVKEIYIRWIGIPILAIIAMLSDGEHMADDPIWLQYLVALGFTAIYWNGACLIIFYFRRKFPGINKTTQRLLLSSLGIIFWMTFGGLPFKMALGFTTWEEVITLSDQAEFLPFNFIAASIICIAYEATYFFSKWKEAFRVRKDSKFRK